MLASKLRARIPINLQFELDHMSEHHDDSAHPAQSKTNRLINEQSPYLRQHAHNPVDWYPWGAEALARAKAENKPILLS
ncbi:MAG: DUF255 domain-containing protein, partial [Candidatus Binataceae bacterium]